MAEQKQGLSANTLSFFDSTIMAIAGTAPGYSIAATTAALIGAVGFQAPGALLWCGIPMFGVVMAFLYLNRWQANAGASYAWVGKALNADLGFLAGWALVVAATVFMVAGAVPAGTATLQLLSQVGIGSASLQDNTVLVSAVGAVWFLFVSFLVIKGIKITTTVQWIMTSIEMVILLVTGIVAFVKFGIHPVNHFTWSWFAPSSSFTVFAGGAIIATFYYWGWDVSANLNEETKDSKRIPGLGAMVGIIFIFLFFEMFTLATQMGLTQKEIADAGTNVIQLIGTKLYGPTWGSLVVIAVMISTIATLETSLIQITRTLFSMGRDGVISKAFGKIHPNWNTPYIASIVITFFALLCFFGAALFPSVSSLMNDAILSIGLQIVFYFSLACIALMVFYRRAMFQSVSNFFFLLLLPFVSTCFLLFVGGANIYDLFVNQKNYLALGLGLGLIILGLIPLVWGRIKKVPFYSEKREVFDPNTAA